jgi:hypothetical protein
MLNDCLNSKEEHLMATLVTGLFKSRSNAERAVEDLLAHGWSRDDISLLMSDATQGREFGLAMASKAPEGAAAGGTIGGVLGAVAAGLVATVFWLCPGWRWSQQGRLLRHWRVSGPARRRAA